MCDRRRKKFDGYGRKYRDIREHTQCSQGVCDRRCKKLGGLNIQSGVFDRV